MMATTGTSSQQLYEIVALAVNLFVGIDAMIRNHNEGSIVSEWALLNCGPNLTNDRVDTLQGEEMCLRVVVVASAIIN